MHGWTNTTTWAAHAELANDEYTYKRLNEFAKNNDRAGFIAVAKSLQGNSTYINWDEIFNAWFEAL